MDLTPGWNWLFTQGVLGFTTALALFGLAWLYRAREKDRLQYQADQDARDEAHRAEIASYVKLVMELQEGWRNDIRQLTKAGTDQTQLLLALGKGLNREAS